MSQKQSNGITVLDILHKLSLEMWLEIEGETMRFMLRVKESLNGPSH